MAKTVQSGANASAAAATSKPKSKAKDSIPSANWLALRKVLPKPAARKRADSSQDFPRKRRKIERSPSPSRRQTQDPAKSNVVDPKSLGDAEDAEMKNGESVAALRRMIFGQVEFTDAQSQPGKYLALDCEMVGVGPEGLESSLARVSLVNFHGAVQLDAFVRQRERVVDYRTEFSGVRETDMVNAHPFPTIQTLVAALLKDRILIGHAVHNDLRALLLSHPHAATRDTQLYAGRFGVVKGKRVALRRLVEQEVGAVIQGGEHSSVTDARATMAVYRLHRKEWERGAPARPRKRTREADAGGDAGDDGDGDSDGDADVDGDWEDASDEDAEQQPQPAPAPADTSKSIPKSILKNKTAHANKTPKTFPGGGRKGVSSGLGSVVRHRGTRVEGGRRRRRRGVVEGARGVWGKYIGWSSRIQNNAWWRATVSIPPDNTRGASVRVGPGV
ncbi:ribonuclease H-like domain-containing protein [Mycena haematopus]|nr:ribonuclease H-like domain-containing protein [Mycena haematopus]